MYDKVEIHIKAGKGGDGSVSFRREKFVPYGGPDGGDGGKGGDVIVRVESGMDDLRKYRQKRTVKADSGEKGAGQKKHGKSGKEKIIDVPPGTLVYKRGPGGTLTMIADLKSHGESVIVAKGGRGGQANVHYASSINQAPHIAQRGEEGEEAELILEMRLIADVGIIGYPNAGKSTLLRATSAAEPKVADYPFTTIEPVLGVVDAGSSTFLMAEIPGLIQGAHTGRGLGDEFLRHAMRTRMLLHLVDGTSESPLEDIAGINEELRQYDITLVEKPQIVAVNKIDIPEVAMRRDEIEKDMRKAGLKPYFISASNGEGINELIDGVYRMLREKHEEPVIHGEEEKVFRPEPVEKRYRIRCEEKGDGRIFHIESSELERLYVAPGGGASELKKQIMFQLKRMGALGELEKIGIEKGDIVKCGDITWYW